MIGYKTKYLIIRNYKYRKDTATQKIEMLTYRKHQTVLMPKTLSIDNEFNTLKLQRFMSANGIHSEVNNAR